MGLAAAAMTTPDRPRHLERFGAAAAGAILFILVLFFAPYSKDGHAMPRWRAKTPVVSTQQPMEAPWLLATMSPAGGIGRRIVIRETWQRLYANASRFDMRFVIANATGPWLPYVLEENKTHGDILMLDHLKETRSIANSIKPMEFFKAVALGRLLRPYSFISKIDDDSFLDATTFYDKYLGPLVEEASENDMQISPTVIGKLPRSGYGWDYPAGAFYTMTWDVMRAAVKEYENGIQGIKDEDALIGKLIRDSGIRFDFQKMPYREAFDFASAESNPWAKTSGSLDGYWHAMGPGAINVHNLKNNPTYLQIAACFNGSGVRLDEWIRNIDVQKWGDEDMISKEFEKVATAADKSKAVSSTVKAAGTPSSDGLAGSTGIEGTTTPAGSVSSKSSKPGSSTVATPSAVPG